MDNNKIIIALLVIIILLLVGIIATMPNLIKTDGEAETTNDAAVNETASVPEVPDTITVALDQFDTKVTKTVGEYTVQAQKWRGTSAGGFEVSLSKNGQQMDRNSYQSRAYFNDGSGWKWSNWDTGETEGATLHKYPVSNSVEIREVEVTF